MAICDRMEGSTAIKYKLLLHVASRMNLTNTCKQQTLDTKKGNPIHFDWDSFQKENKSMGLVRILFPLEGSDWDKTKGVIFGLHPFLGASDDVLFLYL